MKRLALATLIILAGCGRDPTAFRGRIIFEAESTQAMAEDQRCQTAWDVKPGMHATACSWTFADPQSPGSVACHIVFEQPNGAEGIVTELENCATVDQDVMSHA